MELDFRGARPDLSIERRLARLEDIESIKRVKAAYADFCDRSYDPEGLLSLFAEDAVWESNVLGTYRGYAEIRAYFAGLPKTTVWAHHCMICPVVDVNDAGDAAVGRWYLLQLATLVDEHNPLTKESIVVTANYRDRFVKREGLWKFVHIYAHFHQISNLRDGWAQQPFRN